MQLVVQDYLALENHKIEIRVEFIRNSNCSVGLVFHNEQIIISSKCVVKSSIAASEAIHFTLIKSMLMKV